MSAVKPEIISTRILERAARTAYCENLRSDAALLYGEAAARDLDSGKIARAMENKRWHGNSLMWLGCHQEALRELLTVASCRHPEVDPNSIYGAKTDCIMISLYYAKASEIQNLIQAAQEYLARIGKPHWRHRLDLLLTMLQCRQGKFAEALQSGLQAKRLEKIAIDGPRYSHFAYLKWLSRPAFYMGNLQQIGNLLEQTRMAPRCMVSDAIISSCMRLHELRLQTRSGGLPSAALVTARESLPVVAPEDYLWEEFYDVARALLATDDFEAVQRLQTRKTNILPFETAALRTDLEINLLRRQFGLPPWDAELDHPNEIPPNTPMVAAISDDSARSLHEAQSKLDLIAAHEDGRLETNYYASAANLRRQHIVSLMRLIQHTPPPYCFTKTG